MNSNTNEWPAGRAVHLPGGCLACNDSEPNVIFQPESITGESIEYEITKYHDLAKLFIDLNVTVIGVDYFTNQHEIDGIVPPVWKAVNVVNGKFCSIDDLAHIWSDIGHNAYSQKNGRLWDISCRISHQINVCSWRLSKLSSKYRQQLNSRIHKDKFQLGDLFEDLNTWHVYLAMQVFLIDVCILRDYLSEFVNYFIVRTKYSLDVNVTTIGGLLKNIINKVEVNDNVLSYIKNSTGSRGWLKELGEYRDLVVHSSPLARAEQRLFVVSSELDISAKYKLPAIICPMPSNPSEISASRSRGDHFKNFDDQLKLFGKAANGEIPSTDGLMYAHSVIGHLYEFSNMLIKESPLKPKIFSFDESNTIGGINSLPIPQ